MLRYFGGRKFRFAFEIPIRNLFMSEVMPLKNGVRTLNVMEMKAAIRDRKGKYNVEKRIKTNKGNICIGYVKCSSPK